MQQVITFLFYTLMTGVIIIFLQTISIGVMHFLMPKEIVGNYFKKPYFNEFELSLFTGWPYAFFRTLMFVRLIVQPSSGEKRKLPNISREVPKWYRYLSILLLGIIIVNSVVVALTLSIGAVLLAIE
ncbi:MULTISPECIES: hypothetical protein [Vibrio]|jgi:hypothetical protein|uniref:Uncharacterized protein n=2 Tax=Vibrio alginolyticus TaxID=663 RepID=A0AA36XRA4_VIBAL|nr:MULTISPECIES: hypothetical protein [Vibrio]AGV19454.1 hypothetical protein N646_3645 [Vibrio alginolyticus NBRC 15630 = ATCC 17749]AVF69050.1 hypothetical protein AL545_07950 [Vibrio alginolyticus]EGQ9136048.1 hypothetical protein [Vibrio alginolyticus]EGR1298464.1 hypothetical protein [Vibrio alginolyticus]ELB1088573.1 hypothetical protein [Vibrio alginolyticus]